MNKITFEDMQLFVYIVEQGNFTKAAEYYSIPKSTLSRRISNLELRLGTRLLNRSTRHITLTSCGEELYQRAIQILKSLLETEQALSLDQQKAAGRIRVFTPIMLNYLFMEDISNIHHKHPDIIFDMLSREANPDEIQERNFDSLLHSMYS